MRIFFDHQIFSYQAYGGISRYFQELVSHLRGSVDAAVELEAPFSFNEYLKRDMSIKSKDFFPNCNSRNDRLIKFFIYYTLNAAQNRRRLRRGEFDIFHPTFYDPYFIKLLAGQPFVLTIHDMTPELFPEMFPKNSLYGTIVTTRWIRNKQYLAKRADAIVAGSQNTKNDLVRLYGIEPQRVTVVYHGSSFSHITTGLHDIKLPDRYMLYVGERGGHKNFMSFAEAVVPLLKADSSLRIVCAGGGAFITKERGCLEEFGVFDRFISLVDVSDSSLLTLYKRAIAFVFPSLYEGFGIPILEAFSVGCPVALSEASCFPEIAGEAAVYFDPLSSESIRNTLDRLMNDGGLRSELRVKGFTRIKDFSWQKTADEMLSVYRHLVRN